MRPQQSRSAGEGLERSCHGASDGWLASARAAGVELFSAWFAGAAYHKHRHDTYAVGVTDSGVQVFDYRGAVHVSTPGQVVVLYPDEVHDGRAGDTGGFGYRIVYVEPARLADAVGSLRGRPGPLPFVGEAVSGNTTLSRAVDAAFQAPLESLAVDGLVVELARGLLAAERGAAGPVVSRHVDVRAVERARQFLDAEKTRAVHSLELEAITGLTRYDLARQFRIVLGTSPHRYLLIRRLEFARAEIRRQRPLAQIALDAGFADQPHFTRAFRSAFGLTPARYRTLTATPRAHAHAVDPRAGATGGSRTGAARMATVMTMAACPERSTDHAGARAAHRGVPVSRRLLLAGLATTFVPRRAHAQKAPVRIGWLSAGSPADPFLDGFRDGLRKLGHVEGQTVVLETRHASGDLDALRAGAADLARINVAVIVASLTAVRAARTIKDIPIVFLISGDPVEAGLAKSLARPGGNLTGSTFLSLEIAGKRVALLSRAVPQVRTLAALSNTDHPGEKSERQATETAAKALGIDLVYVAFSQSPFGTGPEMDRALDIVRRVRPDAMIVFPEGATMANRSVLASFAMTHRLPTMFGWSEYVDAGGLMSYGASQRDAHARLASYVDKILKGASPAELPIEQPTTFELVVNLKSAKALGLTLSPSLLLQADRVIE